MISEENITFSLRKGLNFRFKIEDTLIEYKDSLFSGRERILINDELVSECRNFKKESEHHFAIDGKEYTLTLKAESFTKGPIRCSLLTSHEVMKQYLITIQPKKGRARKYLPIIGGIVFGVGMVTFTEYFLPILVVWLVFIGTLPYVFTPTITCEEVHNKADADEVPHHAAD